MSSISPKTDSVLQEEPEHVPNTGVEPTFSRRCSIDMIRSEISTGKLLLQKQESLGLISEEHRIELARKIEQAAACSSITTDDPIVTDDSDKSLVPPEVRISDSNSNQDIENSTENLVPKLHYRESTVRDDVAVDHGEQDKISRFTILGYVVESLTRLKSAFSGLVEKRSILYQYLGILSTKKKPSQKALEVNQKMDLNLSQFSIPTRTHQSLKV